MPLSLRAAASAACTTSDDPYEVLGVSRDATALLIKRAYLRLALKHHPDKGGDEDTFKKIVAAYDTLKSGDNLGGVFSCAGDVRDEINRLEKELEELNRGWSARERERSTKQMQRERLKAAQFADREAGRSLQQNWSVAQHRDAEMKKARPPGVMLDWSRAPISQRPNAASAREQPFIYNGETQWQSSIDSCTIVLHPGDQQWQTHSAELQRAIDVIEHQQRAMEALSAWQQLPNHQQALAALELRLVVLESNDTQCLSPEHSVLPGNCFVLTLPSGEQLILRNATQPITGNKLAQWARWRRWPSGELVEVRSRAIGQNEIDAKARAHEDAVDAELDRRDVAAKIEFNEKQLELAQERNMIGRKRAKNAEQSAALKQTLMQCDAKQKEEEARIGERMAPFVTADNQEHLRADCGLKWGLRADAKLGEASKVRAKENASRAARERDLRLGVDVVITGLEKRPELNGTRAHIMERDATGCRFIVEFARDGGAHKLSLRPECLRRAVPAASAPASAPAPDLAPTSDSDDDITSLAARAAASAGAAAGAAAATVAGASSKRKQEPAGLTALPANAANAGRKRVKVEVPDVEYRGERAGSSSGVVKQEVKREPKREPDAVEVSDSDEDDRPLHIRAAAAAPPEPSVKVDADATGAAAVASSVKEEREGPAAEGPAAAPGPRGEALAGCRVRIWWHHDKAWFAGRVLKYYASSGKCRVAYDDGERKNHPLDDSGTERWELIAPASSAGAASAAPADDADVLLEAAADAGGRYPRRRNAPRQMKVEESMIDGQISCPSCREMIRPVSERGCNLVTCHSDAHHPRYFYFCFYCRRELPGGESYCHACPRRVDGTTRRKRQEQQNEWNRQHPVDIE